MGWGEVGAEGEEPEGRGTQKGEEVRGREKEKRGHVIHCQDTYSTKHDLL